MDLVIPKLKSCVQKGTKGKVSRSLPVQKFKEHPISRIHNKALEINEKGGKILIYKWANAKCLKRNEGHSNYFPINKCLLQHIGSI